MSIPWSMIGMGMQGLLGLREIKKNQVATAGNTALLGQTMDAYGKYGADIKDIYNQGATSVMGPKDASGNRSGGYLDSYAQQQADSTALLAQESGGDWANLTRGLNATNKEQVDDLNTRFKTRTDDIRRTYGDVGNEITGRYGILGANTDTTLLGAYGAAGSELSNLRTRSMADLQRTGRQELADINRSYSQQGSAAKADLMRRGMAGTTMGAGAQLAVARERQASMNRAMDSQTLQRVQADSALTSAVASNAERAGAARAEMAANLGINQISSKAQADLAAAGATASASQLELANRAAGYDRTMNLQTQLEQGRMADEQYYRQQTEQNKLDAINRRMTADQGYNAQGIALRQGAYDRQAAMLSGIQIPYTQETALYSLPGMMMQYDAQKAQEKAMNRQINRSWMAPTMGMVGSLGSSAIGAYGMTQAASTMAGAYGTPAPYNPMMY